ncbi:unnamed protein product [Symbiodinium sp. CCMP2456]|nr:unnamed protein product [Symbiodinium sp. CCMP2456]
MNPSPNKPYSIQVADKHGFEFSSQSHDWILQIRNKATGKQCSVFGYTFDVNPALTSAWLHQCKTEQKQRVGDRSAFIVPHQVFLSPSNPFTANYLPRSGMWAPVQEAVNKYGFPVVVKEYGLAVSPYKRVIDEYRCVCCSA